MIGEEGVAHDDDVLADVRREQEGWFEIVGVEEGLDHVGDLLGEERVDLERGDAAIEEGREGGGEVPVAGERLDEQREVAGRGRIDSNRRGHRCGDDARAV